MYENVCPESIVIIACYYCDPREKCYMRKYTYNKNIILEYSWSYDLVV